MTGWPWVVGIAAAVGVLAGFTASAVREHRARKAWVAKDVVATDPQTWTYSSFHTSGVFDQLADSQVTYGPCWSCGVEDADCCRPAYCCVVCRHATNTHPVSLGRDGTPS